jgi:bacillolysin
MRRLTFFTLAGVLCLGFFAQTNTTAQVLANPQQGGRRIAAPRTTAELRQWDTVITQMTQSRELVISQVVDDATLPGRRHESLSQFYRGVPVQGGGITRQVSGSQTVSVFGTIHTGIDLDVTPGLSAADAGVILRRESGREFAFSNTPTLVILPGLTGSYRLAYRATMANAITYFLDANTGRVLRREQERNDQGQVGVGTGVLGDVKKISTTSVGGTFRTEDQLRPTGLNTLDTRSSDAVLDRMLDSGVSFDTDFPTDSDNSWTDAGIVDAHVHSGWSLDYFFKRHNWSGLNGIGSKLFAISHRLERNNAFFIPPPFGPGRGGAVVYGETSGGVPVTVLDVAAHEVMHGVTRFALARRTGQGLFNSFFIDRLGPTSFTFRGDTYTCNNTVLTFEDGKNYPFYCEDGRFVLASNHGGAINEAFSDVFGTSVEFFFQEPGGGPLRAEYLMGEDLAGFGPLRSLINPASIGLASFIPVGYPDHADKFVGVPLIVVEGTRGDPEALDIQDFVIFAGGQAFFPGGSDDGAEHWNATVLGHAFYLAVQGGQNATSGITVQGVGAQNRAQIERAFFRGMTVLMPNAPDQQTAAFAVYQAAVDLFGAASPAAQAIASAMIAVGLLVPA